MTEGHPPANPLYGTGYFDTSAPNDLKMIANTKSRGEASHVSCNYHRVIYFSPFCSMVSPFQVTDHSRQAVHPMTSIRHWTIQYQRYFKPVLLVPQKSQIPVHFAPWLDIFKFPVTLRQAQQLNTMRWKGSLHVSYNHPRVPNVNPFHCTANHFWVTGYFGKSAPLMSQLTL